MIDRENDHTDDEQVRPESSEPEPEIVPNRRERRGHAPKNGGVGKVPGRPHQADFVGRRVFRRTGG